MFDNEIRIPADKEDLIQFAKSSYETERYLYYYNFTKDLKFLKLYQQSLKEFLKQKNIIEKKYLNNIKYEYNIIDIPNSSIKCVLGEKKI